MDFIERAKNILGDNYIYDKIEYKNAKTNVTIVCKKHGEFQIMPQNVLRGQGCPYCSGKRLHIIDFIERATKIHNGKYDYSLSELGEKIKIICKEHGLFEQAADSHLRGKGCPLCAGHTVITTDSFIKKANEIHNGQYEYSLVHYTTLKGKVTIICKKHGEFEQLADSHLKGCGCPKCSKNHYIDEQEFIEKAKALYGEKYTYADYQGIRKSVIVHCEKHGDFKKIPFRFLKDGTCPSCKKEELQQKRQAEFLRKATKVHNGLYDYSLLSYQNMDSMINIKCQKHGLFTQRASAHLSGAGCPKCYYSKVSERRLSDTETFIKKAQVIHKGKYDYSLVKYTKSCEYIDIICKEHGVFKQRASNHLNGDGCPKCGIITNTEHRRMTVEQFLVKANQVHLGKYKYPNISFENNRSVIDIACNKHGIFRQRVDNHLMGKGCPKCNISVGELKITQVLESLGIQYVYQKRFPELRHFSYDFYIPQENLLIEYNGIQHYQYNDFFHKDLHDFHYQKHRDWIKRKFAQTKGLRLLSIPYWDFDNIETILVRHNLN